ncbi:MAG TPA: acyltransferase family protein, partial [Xanthobacteraceae bacterium]|nr:acyltransferase family protein [Xanthobacteraceae bacterium]
SRFWELMLGAWLAAMRARSDDFPRGAGNLAALTGLTLILISLFLIDESKPFPGLWALLPAGGTTLLIWSGNRAWVNRAVLGSKPFVFVGLISYPLYLWHWPLLSFAHVEARGEDLGIAKSLLLLSLAFVLAAATYLFIERPIHNITLPNFRRRWAPAAMLSMAVAALVGIQIPRSEWSLSRFPPKVRALLTFNTGENRLGKGKGCFLRPGRGPSNFKAKCVDPLGENHSPLLLLWGDSHAAHLVPAFRALQKETSGFRLARYTAAGCPAVLAEMPEGKECAEVNRFVMDRISALKPDIVVIAGFWYRYTLPKSKKNFWMLDPSALADTVRRIKSAGVKQVVFVGELPAWKIFQPVISAELLVKTGEVPERTKLRLNQRSLSIDREIKAKVTGAGATFISPVDLLCDSRGCAIKAGESPVYVDKDHLTAAGAQLLVRPILHAADLLESSNGSTIGDFTATVPGQ